MSYCRFSSDNWASDIYCYESDAGFVIHVAGNRVKGDVPVLPEFESRTLQLFTQAYEVQMAFLESAERQEIGGPHDGESFHTSDAMGCLSCLMMLREARYWVPQGAIDAIREEAAAEAHCCARHRKEAE